MISVCGWPGRTVIRCARSCNACWCVTRGLAPGRAAPGCADAASRRFPAGQALHIPDASALPGGAALRTPFAFRRPVPSVRRVPPRDAWGYAAGVVTLASPVRRSLTPEPWPQGRSAHGFPLPSVTAAPRR